MANLPIHNILFLDVETVSQHPQYQNMPEQWQQLWNKKAEQLLKNKENEDAASIYDRAAIYAEFGKVICISCGIINGYGDEKNITIKSFFGDDEKTILQEFAAMLQKWTVGEPKFLCAHNGKEFDFPYLCRRMTVHQIPLPTLLNISGKKPWEIQHYVTMELWKFGDFKSYTSLDLLANTLGIPTPKDDINGSMVGTVYWKENDLPRIARYCEKDVLTTAQILLRLQGESLIQEKNIQIK